jgi:TPP-dependent pyruvate/acetoin dehydrogenase alpha subunit
MVVDEWAISMNRKDHMAIFVPSIEQEVNSIETILTLRKYDYFVQFYRELSGLLARGIPISQIYQQLYDNKLENSFKALMYSTLPVFISFSSQTMATIGITHATKKANQDGSHY